VSGGRSGLTAVVVAPLFLLALFFVPFPMVVPAVAYGPALMILGVLMLSPISKINFSDLAEAIPALSTIVFVSFTYNSALA